MRLLMGAAAVVLLAAPIRADDWTPFYDPAFEIGKTYEKPATVAWLGGEKYLLLVTSDTARTHTVHATAKAGVIKPEQLGEGRTVNAKILSREEDKSGHGYRVKVEILAAK
ncbi:MAG TPA: hypothetical protein VGE74_31435 [Gemmata sp.]